MSFKFAIANLACCQVQSIPWLTDIVILKNNRCSDVGLAVLTLDSQSGYYGCAKWMSLEMSALLKRQ